jgi:anti-anti-sigma factor
MVNMEIDTAVQSADELNLAVVLEQAAKNLEPGGEEVTLDLSRVLKIDSGALRAFQYLAHRAEEKKIKIVLRAVNVNVYKAFKLARLSRCFSFVN